MSTKLQITTTKAVVEAVKTIKAVKTVEKLQPDIAKLCEMLAYRRPANSKTEFEFIKKYIDSLKGVKRDKYGNFYLKVGKAPNTLFTAHTDTVHNKDGMQRVSTEGHKVFTTDKDSTCLGADDGLGIYIMLEMIEAKVEGYYAFFREEEIGGQGSSYAVDQFVDGVKSFRFLMKVNKVISFDRKDTNSIITHQGERCCSNAFTDSLAQAFVTYGVVMEGDDTGSFTDSLNFNEVVPECTNLSVGYYHQHSKNEYVDFDFVRGFLKAVKGISWNNIEIGNKVEDAKNDYVQNAYYDKYINQGGNYYPEAEGYGYADVDDKYVVDELARHYPHIYQEILDTLGVK